MAEMTDFEAFRCVDTYTEAVLKLRDATHAIRRHGADLKEWEAKGKVVKDKIQKEIDVLTTEQAEKRRKGIIAIDALLEKEAKAKEQIEPTLKRLQETQGMLRQVSLELNQAREDKASLIKSAVRESERIMREATDKVRIVESEIEDKVKAAENRLLEVDVSIKQLKQEGINSL